MKILSFRLFYKDLNNNNYYFDLIFYFYRNLFSIIQFSMISESYLSITQN